MRYTTIIDLSEFPALYKNPGIRLVYLHLTLRSGYHDDDRDLIAVSIRTLARETRLTVATVRHALDQLERVELIKREGPMWQVKKFVIEKPITPRAKSRKQERDQEAAKIREEEHQRRQQQQIEYEKQRAKLAAQGKTSFMVYYEEQMVAARRGDPNAIRFVESEKSNYEQHVAAVVGKNKKQ